MGRTRHQVTYGELFTQHLDQLFERGGSAYAMRRLVKIYDAEDADMREGEFWEWIQRTMVFPCYRCGRVFAPGDNVTESQELICERCS
jgi:hypothetical protein